MRTAHYDDAVRTLVAAYHRLPADASVRLAKPTSNLFRPRSAAGHRLDVSAFSGVLDVDVAGRTADVMGMTTYEELVDATLPFGLMPLVVPQLKTITLGGAVTGLGIESSSFRNGGPHESVLELDVLTGDGTVVTATADNEHAELFAGFPNSYGSLGYALRLRIELEPVARFVSLRHVRAGSGAELAALIERACGSEGLDGVRPDFVDGTEFTPDESYLTLGTFTDTPAIPPSDYTGLAIYYRSIAERTEDVLSTRDYLWRWDTDWFWCSRAFGVQVPWVRRLVPRRYLRSSTYWKIIALETKHGVWAKHQARQGKPPEERVIQDIEVPVARTAEFLRFLHEQTQIAPVWVCPLRQRDPAARWPLYQLDPDALYVNVGFWSTVPIRPGESDGAHNRRIEAEVTRLGGRKSLYSTAFYAEDEFRRLYGGQTYDVLKKRYDPDGRLPGLYAKAVQGR
ncbi:MAG: FAD-binding oxidoreductase [Geodermatophilaceae bacterium]|nr:FAD-binding oxidoreductase [Geodermatophilaceae bacterium]